MAGLKKSVKKRIQKKENQKTDSKAIDDMEDNINEKSTGHHVTPEEIPTDHEQITEITDSSNQRKWPQILFLIGLVVVIVMSFVQFPYYAYAPGSVNPLTERVAISGNRDISTRRRNFIHHCFSRFRCKWMGISPRNI